jgi:phage/plasmid-like protein (TIGR03299 family)
MTKMAHAVEKMVFAGATPWHGLGTQINEETGFWDAFELAGLDWTAKTEPLYRASGEQVPAQCVYRDSDNSLLGVVGPRWTPLQNVDAFKVFEPLVDSGDMSIHTAGSLHNGRRVWALCQLNLSNDEIARGDEVSKFVLLSNSHDGKLAVHFGWTPIRVVCANTEAMARASSESKLIRVLHHKNVKENVEKLRDVMDLAKQDFAATTEQYRFLASRQINKADLNKYVRILLKTKPEVKDEDLPTRTKNTINEIVGLFEAGRGNNLPGVSGTYWAAYNGFSEYLNHTRGRNTNNRMDSLWFGTGKTDNKRALDLAVALAS